MAITAVVTLTRETTQINTPVTASLAISNSGGSDVNLVSVSPQMKKTGSSDGAANNSMCNFSLPEFGYVPIVVPAGSSKTVAFKVVPFVPGASFDVSADVCTSDGSEIRATADTLAVTAIASRS